MSALARTALRKVGEPAGKFRRKRLFAWLSPVLARLKRRFFALREGEGGKLVEQVAAVERAHVLLFDRSDMRHQARLQTGLG